MDWLYQVRPGPDLASHLSQSECPLTPGVQISSSSLHQVSPSECPLKPNQCPLIPGYPNQCPFIPGILVNVPPYTRCPNQCSINVFTVRVPIKGDNVPGERPK